MIEARTKTTPSQETSRDLAPHSRSKVMQCGILIDFSIMGGEHCCGMILAKQLFCSLRLQHQVNSRPKMQGLVELLRQLICVYIDTFAAEPRVS